MRETGDVSNDAIEEALTDHHLDEVTEMIERAPAHKPSSESPFTDSSAGCLRGS
jgi:hypothetical protein